MPSEWQEWQHVDETEATYTDRMPVFGGYLYRTRLYETGDSDKQVAVALCFVPKILPPD